MSPLKAYIIIKNHEDAGNRATPPQPKDEELMDLANNGVGISCGMTFKRCDNVCIEKYNNDELPMPGEGSMLPSSNVAASDY